ncbi:minor tail protein [Mycobacterium phage MrMagoo]|uniref:Minor tail protein n=1 Tax=Mycobacterium phage MrMagoo TaxID=1927020 RepID=A0A1L6BYG4_9CAUD|nr:minor tail protein [Mycobacterium phage MrMagoo]APQ42138.1 minor tail protein [Mycobacterium phage MrMagoo]ARM70213.1 minor tail protein [Mycobacterium phage GardenSalsa]
MPPLNVHAPDPESPKGMAFILGAGMVDPRPGNNPNQPMAIVQSWEPTSELWYALGLRYHPELATKWLVGGGQFECAQIVDEKPDEPEMTLEQGAEEVLEFIAAEHPEHAEVLRQIHAAGTEKERIKLVRQYDAEIKRMLTLIKYISTKPQE